MTVGLSCRGEAREYGVPVGTGPAVELSALLPDVESHLDERVLIEARILEVCPTAGCWFVLEDGGEQLHVTLSTFTLPRAVEGERCRVAGTLVLREERPTLLATGLDILAD